MDDCEIERLRLLVLSATNDELEEYLQASFDGQLGCLIKLARHYYSRGDDERLSRAIEALLTEPDVKAA